MFDSLRRARLQREGLSCGKVRRKHQEGELELGLRTHGVAAALLGVGFVVTLQLLAGLRPNEISAMDMLCTVVLGAIAILHWRVTLRQEAADNGAMLLMALSLLTQFAASWALLEWLSSRGWEAALTLMVLPHAFAPILLGVTLGRRAGLFAALHGGLLGAMLFQPEQPAPFLTGSAVVGFFSVLATRRVRRRAHLLAAGLHTGLSASAFALVMGLADGGIFTDFFSRVILWPMGIGVATGVAVGAVLPVLEFLFGVTTQVTWLELADLNHPLMRRLSLEAPGTYHHSLMVASIAEAAAEAIAANAAMTRVCAYFHDIGKLTKPEYFIENMDPADNPHEGLTARMSALILIAHVKDGVDLGVKHLLNRRIIDVIEQHHGTSLAWFFYQRALDQKAEALALFHEGRSTEDDIPQVSETTFRYPGPKPQFKEAAIISLADAIESSSRSLDHPTSARVEALVDDIVGQRMSDGQLDECDLTLGELARIKASFIKTLLSMMHSRVKYRNLGGGERVTTGSPHPQEGRTIAMAALPGGDRNNPNSPRSPRRQRKPKAENLQPPASAA